MESKREKFVRLAEARTNKALNMIQLLGNLANTSSYEYSDKDINAIFGTLEKEIKIAKQKFESASEESKKSNFKLEK